MNKTFNNKKVIFSLVLPGILLFFAAVFFPIIISLFSGMTDAESLGMGKFIGFANYKEILTEDATFWNSLFHALLLGLGYVVLQHPLCLSFAILLDKVGGKIEKTYRIAYFIPCMISTVITAKLWINVLNGDYGLLNKVLSFIGFSSVKMDWLGSPFWALLWIILIACWQNFGWGLLIYYSGLKGIPGDVYEAARIDGATGLKVVTSITLPLLLPVIRLNVTLAFIGALKMMDTVYLTTNGGPGDSTHFIATYLYQMGFRANRYGYANAIAVLLVIACILTTFLLNKLMYRESVEI